MLNFTVTNTAFGWVAIMASEKGLVVFDQEAALRINKENRSLSADLTSGDGLHLNKKAYAVLDELFAKTFLY